MGYSLCMLGSFENDLISRIFGVFWSDFLHRKTVNDLQNAFSHDFWNINFSLKVRFLHGLQPLNNGPFSKSLISRIFDVFCSGFLNRTSVNDLYNGFSHVFCNFNFRPKVRILHGLQPLHDGPFSKWSHFSNIWCFFQRFFAQNNCKLFVECIFTCFLEF